MPEDLLEQEGAQAERGCVRDEDRPDEVQRRDDRAEQHDEDEEDPEHRDRPDLLEVLGERVLHVRELRRRAADVAGRGRTERGRGLVEHDACGLDRAEGVAGVRVARGGEIEPRRGVVLGDERVDRVLDLLAVLARERGRDPDVVRARREHRGERGELVGDRVEGVLGLLLELLRARGAGEALRGEGRVGLGVEVVGEPVEGGREVEGGAHGRVALHGAGGAHGVGVRVEGLDLGVGGGQLAR